MAKQPALMLYTEKASMFNLLTDEQVGRVIKSAISYFLTGYVPNNLTQAEHIVFEGIRLDIDRNAEKYAAICERNRKNGSKGGRPPAPNETYSV